MCFALSSIHLAGRLAITSLLGFSLSIQRALDDQRENIDLALLRCVVRLQSLQGFSLCRLLSQKSFGDPLNSPYGIDVFS